MSDETAPPEAELVPDDIEQFMPSATDMVLHDRTDDNELVAVLDRHDVEQIVMEIQRRALKVWIYDIPGESGGARRKELSYKGVRDVVGLMNHTGRVRIGTMPETLRLERLHEDIGHGGPETLVRATIFARDDVTGQAMPGVATEPLYMKLTDSTAAKKRAGGKEIAADNRVFDPFAETKAANKAVRNALRTFIPEEAAQAVLAMYEGTSSRVQRIQTATEATLAELPPPLDDDRAKALISECNAIYDEIRGLGGGRGKIALTPGMYFGFVTHAQHSHEQLENLVGYLKERHEALTAQYAAEGVAS